MNGGGFLVGNFVIFFENLNIWSNFIEMGSMMLFFMLMLFLFGCMLSRYGKWVYCYVLILFVVMFFIFIVIFILIMWSEYCGNLILVNLGIYGLNMEGKEVWFGVGLLVLFIVIMMVFIMGFVNNMYDSLMFLGGLGLMVLMMLNVVFGGEGVGFMNLLIYVLLMVFICSLMVGKILEYLNMLIGVCEMKCIVLVFFIYLILILVFLVFVFMIFGVSESIMNLFFYGIL